MPDHLSWSNVNQLQNLLTFFSSRTALYCSLECAKTHWKHHKKSCRAPQVTRNLRYPPRDLGAPTHNLIGTVLSEPHETAMMKDFYRWLKLWYPSFVEFAQIRMAVESHGQTKTRTHALVFWIGTRSIFQEMERYQTEVKKVSEQQDWGWNARDWGNATAFVVCCIPLILLGEYL